MIVQIFYLFVSHVSLKVLPNVYQYIYSKCRNHQVWRSLGRKHVFMVGATGRIGRVLAMKFAERGMSIVLIDRDESKLLRLKGQIDKLAECYIHVIGRSRNNSLSFVDRYDVGVLVNCDFMLDEYPGHFVEKPVEDVMNFNLIGRMLFIKRVLINMMENRYGYVLNIGSLAGEFPAPLYSAFGSSEHALRSLSESLYYELEAYNINVEYISTGYMLQDDSKILSLLNPSVDVFAESVLSIFGSGRMSVPYLPHFLLYLLFLCIPSPFLGRLLFRKSQRIMMEMKDAETILYEPKTK